MGRLTELKGGLVVEVFHGGFSKLLMEVEWEGWRIRWKELVKENCWVVRSWILKGEQERSREEEDSFCEWAKGVFDVDVTCLISPVRSLVIILIWRKRRGIMVHEGVRREKIKVVVELWATENDGLKMILVSKDLWVSKGKYKPTKNVWERVLDGSMGELTFLS